MSPDPVLYAPVGRCIYCGEDSDPASLSKEHIIPYSLGGNHVLPKASCESCRAITGKFEGTCVQTMFQDARLLLDLPSRRHRRDKTPKPSLKVEHVGRDGASLGWQELAANDFPFILFSIELSPAGLLCGRGPTDRPRMRALATPSPSFAQNYSRLPRSATVGIKLDDRPFARMLAKIAHSLAIAVKGPRSFAPYLTAAIRGADQDIYSFVGGAAVTPKRESGLLHDMTVYHAFGHLMVDVQLFAAFNAPAYTVLVGKDLTRLTV